jgi:hypothetical protein
MYMFFNEFHKVILQGDISATMDQTYVGIRINHIVYK